MGTRRIDAFTSAIGQPDRVFGAKQMGQPSGKVTAHHVTVARGQSPACHQAESDAATPEARSARVLLEVEKAEVILPSFTDNGLCRFLRMIRKQAIQFLVYLTLKVLGVGRKPDRTVVATCPDSCRGYISKGFADPGPRFDLDLRVIASGGESVADELHRWSERDLEAVINEFYGLTEVNHLVGGCEALWPGRPGWMGLPYPGRDVALLDENGEEVSPGEIGEIAVRPGDPTQMLEYWGNPAATEGMRRDGWIMTGDQATVDANGYIRFLGRDDDMTASAGYRIGPAEVEESLVRHAAVAEVAVIPAPDRIRGHVVKAMVVLADGHQPGDELTAELQAQVKTQLAAYKYPRIVEYVENLPKTSTGKLNRKLLAAQARSS